jgi:hypothetical protein
VGDPDKIGHALLFLETELRQKRLAHKPQKMCPMGTRSARGATHRRDATHTVGPRRRDHRARNTNRLPRKPAICGRALGPDP